jgi:hypothetical protein
MAGIPGGQPVEDVFAGKHRGEGVEHAVVHGASDRQDLGQLGGEDASRRPGRRRRRKLDRFGGTWSRSLIAATRSGSSIQAPGIRTRLRLSRTVGFVRRGTALDVEHPDAEVCRGLGSR